MIYGQLPPETRSTQARLFNEENTGYDVLVASDAIGMGLNLNIKRIVFHTTVKIAGSAGIGYIEPSQIKQIGGRAGRKSSQFKFGEVTTWQEVDLAYLKAVFTFDPPVIKAAGIFPSVPQIELFSEELRKHHIEIIPGGSSTSDDISDALSRADSEHDTVKMETAVVDSSQIRCGDLLDKFAELSRVDSKYFLANYESIAAVSNWLQSIPLPLEDRFQFANAPANLRDATAMHILYQFAASYAMKRPVALNVRLPSRKPRTVQQIQELCQKHNYLELYLWLGLRYPKFFVEREICQMQKVHALKMIEEALLMISSQGAYMSPTVGYKKNRDMIHRIFPDDLPPIEYGFDIREATKANLLGVDKDKLVLLNVKHVKDTLPEGATQIEDFSKTARHLVTDRDTSAERKNKDIRDTHSSQSRLVFNNATNEWVASERSTVPRKEYKVLRKHDTHRSGDNKRYMASSEVTTVGSTLVSAAAVPSTPWKSDANDRKTESDDRSMTTRNHKMKVRPVTLKAVNVVASAACK
jgi:hypothetical protein